MQVYSRPIWIRIEAEYQSHMKNIYKWKYCKLSLRIVPITHSKCNSLISTNEHTLFIPADNEMFIFYNPMLLQYCLRAVNYQFCTPPQPNRSNCDKTVQIFRVTNVLQFTQYPDFTAILLFCYPAILVFKCSCGSHLLLAAAFRLLYLNTGTGVFIV